MCDRAGFPKHLQVESPGELGWCRRSVPSVFVARGEKSNQRQILKKGKGTDKVKNLDGGINQTERSDCGRQSAEWEEGGPIHSR